MENGWFLAIHFVLGVIVEHDFFHSPSS
jgi:hypothetical protein